MGNCDSKNADRTPVEEVKKDEPAAGEPSPKKEEEPQQEAPPEAAATNNKVTVAIVGARGLRNADWFPGYGKSDCYCTISLEGSEEELYRTKVMDDTLTPVWKEETEVEVPAGKSLEFRVYDADIATRTLLGKITLEAAAFNQEVQLQESGKEAGKEQAYLRLKMKMPGEEDYPKGPPSEITCEIERETPSQPLGLDICTAESTFLFVSLVKDGPFRTYNNKAETETAKQVKQFDFIAKVNEVTGSSKEMLEEMKKPSKKVEVLIRRPQEVCAAIEKKAASTPLGLTFPKKIAGEALLISTIGAGPFLEWNEKKPDQKVCENDRVIAVGDFRGPATELKKKMETMTKFQVTVVRATPAAKEAKETSWSFW